MKFTSGPWTIAEQSHGYGIYAKTWGRIAEVYSGTPDEPNARLIAAAPDLYEACKEMMARLTEMFDRHERPTYSGNADSDLDLILASGKAALLKVEG